MEVQPIMSPPQPPVLALAGGCFDLRQPVLPPALAFMWVGNLTARLAQSGLPLDLVKPMLKGTAALPGLAHLQPHSHTHQQKLSPSRGIPKIPVPVLHTRIHSAFQWALWPSLPWSTPFSNLCINSRLQILWVTLCLYVHKLLSYYIVLFQLKSII